MVIEQGTSATGEKLNSEQAEVFVFPTSFAQQRLWFFDQLHKSSSLYNVSTALRLTGLLNITALEQAFNEIARRHEVLRTSFILVDSELVQVIAPSITIPLSTIDLRNIEVAERSIRIRQIATKESQRLFNLTTAPLLRVTLIQLEEAQHVLLLNLHHIVADGWSIGVLIRELSAFYQNAVCCRDVTCNVSTTILPDLPIQYADYAQWQRAWLTGEVLETQLAYWNQLDGIEVLNFPTDRIRPPVPSYRGEKQFLQLPQSLSESLQTLSQFEGVTLFMTLLAGFKILLYRYTQQTDIVVGSPIANRNRSEIEGLIGFFVNSLVLRTDLSGNPTFLELLARVRSVTLGAYAHQDLPFEKLVESLQPERSLSYHPLFQVAFSLQNTPVEALELPGLTFEVFEIENYTAKLDLEFHLWQDQGINVQVVYSTDLFDGATITRMLGHFQTLLESIVANPHQRVSDLQILTDVELHQLLIEFNPPLPPEIRGEEQRGVCFHQLFEVQVEQTPDAIALVFEDEQLTYRELNIRANQLAHYLQQVGVKPEVLVGICLERSIDMIVGVLAILKAGGAYLPLDPTYPAERLKFMLEDAQLTILLTHSYDTPFIKGDQLIYINQNSDITQQPPINPISQVTPNNLAYIIYTSGSTGKPKGVQIEHQGLSNLIHAQKSTFNLQPTARVLQFASLSFDASIFEIVMALATGGTLYLAKKESLLPGKPLTELLLRHKITHVTLPPTVLAVLPQTDLSELQTIICAGEPCTQDIVKKWKEGRRFFNAYGVTEATVWSTVAEITSVTEKLSIGRPITNTQVYILDKHENPTPIGVIGELYICSDGLARGYINSTLAREGGLRSYRPTLRGCGIGGIYKTGDLGRYLPNGDIEFLGRIDNQVKIRGFRIELEEIETVLTQHKDVQQSVVVVKNNQLIAYIVPNRHVPTTVELREFLKQKLPEYMAPSAFVILDFLPLTPAGKIDYHALPAPNHTTDKSFIAPRTETELTLFKIWAEVLNIERVSINDNFFDLGGNSLLAVQLIERIHKQLEQNLPLSALFLNPTIETLASQLCSDAPSWSPLVAIQPNGENPPLFCVHPIFGVVLPYFELAYNLGKNQPFYGLQPVGIDGESTPLTRIEDMAACYIEALRTIQPNGPYFLAGWSFGGLVAFEMAQQLHKSGDEVALLALLDTRAPVSSNQYHITDSLKYIFTVAARNIWSFLLDYCYLLLASNNNKFIKRIASNILSRFMQGDTAIANLISEESESQILNELTIRPMVRIFQANTKAALNYNPQVYPKRITLFKTNPQSKGAVQNLNFGWDILTSSEVDTHILPGNHLNMMKTPNVETLAQKLKACLLEKYSD
ncbi:amino acid adenylation domain-containing protein [Calothrix sp. NIES-4071]|nr:amino acid adenylation domain-containing protein [Calothrix sp. NIES-4071]BAZ60452.1 amino acid adenylation domain-containing protein [Calothrix sp. NIES-4105]